jgi:hypothetical protein
MDDRVQDAMDDLENLDEQMLNIISMLEYYAQGMDMGVLGNGEIFSRTVRHIKTSIENMRVTLEGAMSALTLTHE